MWPEESFGGVTDEQFWDDLSSDKPLANTARTAQPDGESRPRPENLGGPRSARPGQSRLGPLPGSTPGASAAERAPERSGDRTAALPTMQSGVQPPHAQSAPAPQSQAATQAFPAAGSQAAGPRTGPQAAYTGPQAAYTGPQSAYTGPQSAYTGPQAAYTGQQPGYANPNSAYTGPQPAYGARQSVPTGQQPARTPRPVNQPQSYAQQHVPPAQAQPPAQSMPPTQGLPAIKNLPGAGADGSGTAGRPASRGRHSSGEDPLTSDKFSQRAAPDGRSYQNARRARDISREQYDAALSQETQTFSMSDTDPGSGSYPAQPLPANTGGPRRRHAAESPYGTDSYGRDSSGTGSQPYPYSQQPGGQAPSYDDGYGPDSGNGGYDHGGRGGRSAAEPRRARETSARDSAPRDSAPRDSAPRDAAPRDNGPRDGFRRSGRPVYPDKRGGPGPYDPRGGAGR
jgi:hypothetical protein